MARVLDVPRWGWVLGLFCSATCPAHCSILARMMSGLAQVVHSVVKATVLIKTAKIYRMGQFDVPQTSR